MRTQIVLQTSGPSCSLSSKPDLLAILPLASLQSVLASCHGFTGSGARGARTARTARKAFDLVT